jgi:hypothetical protein
VEIDGVDLENLLSFVESLARLVQLRVGHQGHLLPLVKEFGLRKTRLPFVEESKTRGGIGLVLGCCSEGVFSLGSPSQVKKRAVRTAGQQHQRRQEPSHRRSISPGLGGIQARILPGCTV